ncbi:WD40 repeat domain-containing protein [Nostoc sp.]|uniref:WD40 repeat domain-containing protein n=1 Tax=Nostoc sp. TaxID=1180 RepID=UPI002FFA7262
MLGASPIAPTQPVISRLNTPLSWECVHIIPGISWKIALSPKEDILASVAGRVIHLFSSTTGQLLRTLSGHSERVNSVAISSDGQMLASGSDDKTIKLWSIATGKEIYSLSHFNSVKSVAFTPNGDGLAAGDNSGNIKIWRSQLVVQ